MEHAGAGQEAIARWRAEIETANRKNADTCVSLAARGIFVEIGQKCAFCLHVLPGGCRLRLIAGQQAAE